MTHESALAELVDKDNPQPNALQPSSLDVRLLAGSPTRSVSRFFFLLHRPTRNIATVAVNGEPSAAGRSDMHFERSTAVVPSAVYAKIRRDEIATEWRRIGDYFCRE